MTSARLDASTALTAPFTATPQHEALVGLAGRWTGDTKTYFDPAAEPEASPTEASIEPMLGGRWIRIDYQGTAMGKPHAGVLWLGFHNDPQVHEAAWIDSFHTGTAIMMLVGEPRTDGLISVLGSYAAGPERWGWRTTLRRDDEALVLESFNISPAGQEDRAVLTRLRRA